ncbi:hypothetical protein GFO_0146 [Christiangramia forsetii KT0803]|uniref:Uncharacterized protein n=1 Tax=Christiangramia forsetii (strain DSM 17595 / CGMCC 1.15422 / KT0803) TaxID=411154 RepID=A0LXP0_CHRFK|nr:hypothetical protein GFO_0146 [Christiangramia forsetii KT0803]
MLKCGCKFKTKFILHKLFIEILLKKYHPSLFLFILSIFQNKCFYLSFLKHSAFYY